VDEFVGGKEMAMSAKTEQEIGDIIVNTTRNSMLMAARHAGIDLEPQLVDRAIESVLATMKPEMVKVWRRTFDTMGPQAFLDQILHPQGELLLTRSVREMEKLLPKGHALCSRGRGIEAVR